MAHPRALTRSALPRSTWLKLAAKVARTCRRDARGKPVRRCDTFRTESKIRARARLSYTAGGTGKGDEEHRDGDSHEVERLSPVLVLHDDTGRREQSQSEGREDKGGKQRPSGECLRGPETPELPETERARDKRSTRQGACDGPGREGYGREPPGPRTNASAPQQPLVQSGEGHERESLDGDPHEQPSDVEVRELGRRPRQLAALAAHGPERHASERHAHDEPDATPGPFTPQVRGRLPGRELAQASVYN